MVDVSGSTLSTISAGLNKSERFGGTTVDGGYTEDSDSAFGLSSTQGRGAGASGGSPLSTALVAAQKRQLFANPQQAFLVSLIAQLCAARDATPRLFLSTCTRLYQVGLLESLDFLVDLGLLPFAPGPTIDAALRAGNGGRDEAAAGGKGKGASGGAGATKGATAAGYLSALLRGGPGAGSLNVDGLGLGIDGLGILDPDGATAGAGGGRGAGVGGIHGNAMALPGVMGMNLAMGTGMGMGNGMDPFGASGTASVSSSRFRREFEELGMLGSGAFGTVLRVRHRIDGGEYAVKRIVFSASAWNDELKSKVMREVHCLARLDHENVVRYYTAWLEPAWLPDLDDLESESARAAARAHAKLKTRGGGGAAGAGAGAGGGVDLDLDSWADERSGSREGATGVGRPRAASAGAVGPPHLLLADKPAWQGSDRSAKWSPSRSPDLAPSTSTMKAGAGGVAGAHPLDPHPDAEDSFDVDAFDLEPSAALKGGKWRGASLKALYGQEESIDESSHDSELLGPGAGTHAGGGRRDERLKGKLWAVSSSSEGSMEASMSSDARAGRSRGATTNESSTTSATTTTATASGNGTSTTTPSRIRAGTRSGTNSYSQSQSGSAGYSLSGSGTPLAQPASSSAVVDNDNNAPRVPYSPSIHGSDEGTRLRHWDASVESASELSDDTASPPIDVATRPGTATPARSRRPDTHGVGVGVATKQLARMAPKFRYKLVLYVQMAVVGNRSLRDWLNERNKRAAGPKDVDVPEALALFQGALRGLAHVHSQRVIHRDFKPSNIFLAEDAVGARSVKLGDFGLAKDVDEDSMDYGGGSRAGSRGGASVSGGVGQRAGDAAGGDSGGVRGVGGMAAVGVGGGGVVVEEDITQSTATTDSRHARSGSLSLSSRKSSTDRSACVSSTPPAAQPLPSPSATLTAERPQAFPAATAHPAANLAHANPGAALSAPAGARTLPTGGGGGGADATGADRTGGGGGGDAGTRERGCSTSTAGGGDACEISVASGRSGASSTDALLASLHAHRRGHRVESIDSDGSGGTASLASTAASARRASVGSDTVDDDDAARLLAHRRSTRIESIDTEGTDDSATLGRGTRDRSRDGEGDGDVEDDDSTDAGDRDAVPVRGRALSADASTSPAAAAALGVTNGSAAGTSVAAAGAASVVQNGVAPVARGMRRATSLDSANVTSGTRPPRAPPAAHDPPPRAVEAPQRAPLRAGTRTPTTAGSTGSTLAGSASTTPSLHTSKVGTRSYASPEQLAGQEYDEKADIFSLGLVLLELLCPFSTAMERARVFDDARSRQRCAPSVAAVCPDAAPVIECMVHPDPSQRPSSAELLMHPLFVGESSSASASASSSTPSSYPYGRTPSVSSWLSSKSGGDVSASGNGGADTPQSSPRGSASSSLSAPDSLRDAGGLNGTGLERRASVGDAVTPLPCVHEGDEAAYSDTHDSGSTAGRQPKSESVAVAALRHENATLREAVEQRDERIRAQAERIAALEAALAQQR